MDLVQVKGLGRRGIAGWLPGLLLLASQLAPAAELPAWQALALEQKAYGLVARSRLEVVADAQRQNAWVLSANSSIAKNSEAVTLTLDADSGGLLQKVRLSRGSGKRSKSFQYLADHILRERREPSRWSSAPPEDWPVSSRREIAYPGNEKPLVLTDANALVLLAGYLQPGGRDSQAVVVHTDFNFYRVVMTASDGPDLEVDYAIAGEQERETGVRPTVQVSLQVSPLGEAQKEPDFSLMGLQSDITLLFGRDSGYLLQARGVAPRAGDIAINLHEVTRR